MGNTKNQFPHDYETDNLIRADFDDFSLYVTQRYRTHYIDHKYEPFSTDIFRNLVKEDSVVVDVGANYGYYTMLAASRNKKGKTYAFEPVRETCEVLKKNVRENGFDNVDVHNVAISESSGEAEFNVTEASDSAGFYDHPNTKTLEKRTVKTSALDDFFGDKKIDLLKLDTEGHELSVLRGMKNTLLQNSRIKLLIEFNPKCLGKAGVRPDALLDELKNAHFEIFFLKEDERRIFRLGNVSEWEKIISEQDYCNILCVPREEAQFVFFVSHSGSRGGAELSLLENVRELSKGGVLCHVALQTRGFLSEEFKKLPVSVSISPLPWWTRREALKEEDLFQAILDSERKLILDMALVNPDVVYTNTSTLPQGAVAAHALGLKHIWHLREYGEQDHGLDYLIAEAARYKFIYKYSDRIVFNSRALLEHAKMILPTIDDKSSVVYNVVEIPREIPPAVKKFQHENALKILILGSFQEGKGQKDGISAISALLDDGFDIELILAGGIADRSYFDSLQEMIEKSGTGDRVRVLEFQPNPFGLISEADLLLVCSRKEAFGRVAVEAMFLGKPIIAPRSGGIVEIVDDNKTGYLYVPGDISDLSEKIKHFLVDKEKLQVFGNEAIFSVREKFSSEKTRQELSNIISALIEKKDTGKDELSLRVLFLDLDKNLREKDILQEKVFQLEIENQKKDIELDFVKSSKFWKLRGIWEKMKFVVFHPVRFARKYGYRILSVVFHSIRFWRKYSGKVSVSAAVKYTKKIFLILKSRGPRGLLEEGISLLKRRFFLVEKSRLNQRGDVLFVIGSYLDAPVRYRCDFQKEQLELNGLSCSSVFFTDVNPELAKSYDVLILFRVPITDEVRSLINYFKQLNKMVIFDIDDIMFEKDLLKSKHEVLSMSKLERAHYFEGVERTLETMRYCDFGIASTNAIANRMKRIIPRVIVNRNSISKELRSLSEEAFFRKEAENRISSEVILGYFSGSNTHNDDFRLIEGALIRAMRKNAKIRLFLVGHLDMSDEMKEFSDRIIRRDLVKWRELPMLLANIDINLAPLVVNDFNNGKSELKYTEAALLRKPTIASASESFLYAIQDGITGFIASTGLEWEEKILKLVSDAALRKRMGEAAYENVLTRYDTEILGKNLKSFIELNRRRKIVYISPSTKISGGVMVICQHLKLLQQKGYNVEFLTQDEKNRIDWIDDFSVPVISCFESPLKGQNMIDVAVATLWSTLDAVKKCQAKKKIYLVQNKEHHFYHETDPRYLEAKNTYIDSNKEIAYVTISKWCQDWLKEEFGKKSDYIPNGIDLVVMRRKRPIAPVPLGTTRILVEGNPDDDYKNVDEAFRILQKIHSNDLEVWFISYGGHPKKWYRYDRFFRAVPFSKMSHYYSSCDILLKTSKLESFSYPPLEMMACGGVCLVARNGGNAEYIRDGYNAITYNPGKIDEAASLLNELICNRKLRHKLAKGGRETAKSRQWSGSMSALESVIMKDV